MFSSVLPDKTPFTTKPPRKTPSWYRRSSAALARRHHIGVGVAVRTDQHTGGSATAGQKPNILFIMGDDIGWMQPRIYHHGLMVGETPNIDRIGKRARSSCTTMPSRVVLRGAMPSSPA